MSLSARSLCFSVSLSLSLSREKERTEERETERASLKEEEEDLATTKDRAAKVCLETVFVCIFVCIFVYFRAFLLLANLNFSPQKSRFADTTFDTKDRREKTHALTTMKRVSR